MSKIDRTMVYSHYHGDEFPRGRFLESMEGKIENGQVEPGETFEDFCQAKKDLKAAAARLTEDKWTKNTMLNAQKNFCALGAFYEQEGLEAVEFKGSDAAIDLLHKAAGILGKKYYPMMQECKVPHFNDNPCTTFGMIQEMFATAIALADQKMEAINDHEEEETEKSTPPGSGETV